MKTKHLFLTCAFLLATISIQAQSRNIVRQKRIVAPFTAIDASGGWDVIIQQGNRQEVIIEVNEDRLNEARTEVRNGTLHIYSKSKNRIRTIIGGRKNVKKAYITVTNLRSLSASGGVDIDFKTPLTADNFAIKMSGGSNLNRLTLACKLFSGNFSGGCDANVRFTSVRDLQMDASGGCDVVLSNISSDNCSVKASGGCDIKVSGRTNNLTLSASGGVDIHASKLIAKGVKADCSGAADASVYATEFIDVKLSGACDFECYGHPSKVIKNIDKSSSLRFR